MERPAKSLAALVLGLGVGAVGGAYLGAAALWPGIVAGALGVGLSLVGSQPTAVSGEVTAQTPSERPQLSGLGTRVEKILRLAQEQADDKRTKAEREAERTLSEARSEARLILERARAEAADLTEISKPEVDRGSSEK